MAYNHSGQSIAEMPLGVVMGGSKVADKIGVLWALIKKTGGLEHPEVMAHSCLTKAAQLRSIVSFELVHLAGVKTTVHHERIGRVRGCDTGGGSLAAGGGCDALPMFHGWRRASGCAGTSHRPSKGVGEVSDLWAQEQVRLDTLSRHMHIQTACLDGCQAAKPKGKALIVDMEAACAKGVHSLQGLQHKCG
eukprot:1079417-Pelagomonas_calceolata.AAC.2